MTVLGGVLVGIGVLLTLLAAVGILRFPDVLTRASASTKAAGLGVACVLAGSALLFATPEAGIKLSIAVLVQFATAPVGGHVIARAAYRAGTPLWERTGVDQLAETSAKHASPPPPPTTDD